MELINHVMDDSTRFVATGETTSANLGDEAVLLDLRTGRYFGVNHVGSRVWDLLQEPISVGEIIEAIRNEFTVDDAELRSDIIDLLTEMDEQNLIEHVAD